MTKFKEGDKVIVILSDGRAKNKKGTIYYVGIPDEYMSHSIYYIKYKSGRQSVFTFFDEDLELDVIETIKESMSETNEQQRESKNEK